jgi:hypothetical protein
MVLPGNDLEQKWWMLKIYRLTVGNLQTSPMGLSLFTVSVRQISEIR